MIRLDNTDELLELITQDLKEFVRFYNPYVTIHKKLYNLMLQIPQRITLKLYSVFTDRQQLITASLLEFVCFSLDNFELEIYLEEEKHSNEHNLALYWIEKDRNFPIFELNTDTVELDYASFLESIQLGMIDIIKENVKLNGSGKKQ